MPGRDHPTRSHGGVIPGELAALGVPLDRVLDVSSSCNPYGPCAQVLDAIRAAPVDRYPDPTAAAARAAIADQLATSADRIVLGHGAAELLWTLAAVLVRPGTRAVIAEPTFGEFPAAVRHAGGELCAWRARPDDGFAVDLAAISRLLDERAATVAYLCSPGTPTGNAIPAAAVRALAEAHPAVTLVFDQSFATLSERWADLAVAMPDNVACVRSLTKDHAIPGVRVGYAVGSPALIARIEGARPAWPTSAITQAAAIAACAAAGFVADSRARVLADRRALADQLAGLGLRPAPSTAGFLAVATGDAAGLRRRLLERHHILVRDCTSFGLPDHIRIAARPAADRARLVTALATELAR